MSGIRILHVIDSSGIYGAETVLLNLASEQVARGDGPLLLSIGGPDVSEKAIETQARRLGIRCLPLRMRDGLNLAAGREILRVADDCRVDIIHSHGYKGNILLGLQRRGTRGIPVITTLHGWTATSTWSKLGLYRALDQRMLSRLDGVVLVNDAMRPDIIVVRHHAAGAVHLLARKCDCAVVNAGDGAHEHPTQALLDALTVRRNKGGIHGLVVAICGDILHSRVARSNIILLNALGARVRVVAPSTLLPVGIERFGVEVTRDMREGLRDADIVMMLRLQRERMNGSFVPSTQEYFHYFGLDQKKLTYAKPDALVMHPGPMNRGVEIDTAVADGAQSLIREQVEMGVAVRMAVLEAMSRTLPNA
jgi:aspartate carbamoyltransferase